MKHQIKLLNYNFIFEDITDDDLGRCVLISYYNYNSNNPCKEELKKERISSAVMPYKPEFNAEYALEDLSEEIFDDLRARGFKSSLQDWLREQYFMLQFIESMEGETENEKRNVDTVKALE